MSKTARIAVLIAAGMIIYDCAADVLLFPQSPKTISAETMPYAQTLHAGTENDTFYMRGRFGVDFPVVGYDFNGGDGSGEIGVSPSAAIFLGINAAAHINMRPTSGMRFPVDNFYAVLALYFSGTRGAGLSWRLYPIYHVSAHLADGYPDDILKSDVKAVSSEMVRGEVYYKPSGDILELGIGAGWYYHVCAQKELKYRADVSMLVTPPSPILSDILSPFALIRLENVNQEKNHFGIDVSAGIFILNLKDGERGIGISLRYFDRLHSSYYFEKYEKGWGAELTFLY
jgi:hypothetical protein